MHLSGESAGRVTGDDIQCRLEVRPEGKYAESDSGNASTVDSGVNSALRKVWHVLDTVFGRANQHKGGSSMRGAESS